MTEMRFSAKVTEDCKLSLEAPAVWAAALSDLRGQPVIVTLEKPKKRRSNSQNAYWYGVVVPFFLELWSRARRYPHGLRPYTKDQVHEVLVEALAGCEDGPLPGTRIRLRTRDMDTATFAKLVDRARELAMHDYGAPLPAPGEKWEDVA